MVTAIAILGVILVGVVLAKARHTHQLEQARQRCAAVDVADELITEWWTRAEGVPIGQSGIVEGNTSLTWRTAEIDNTSIEALGARVVRVTLRPTRPANETDESTDEPLVVVDLVLPGEENAEPEEHDHD